jgi:hypothetical protein
MKDGAGGQKKKNGFDSATLLILETVSLKQCCGSRPPFDTDTDPACHFDTDPDPIFQLKRIRIRLFHPDPDPYRFKEILYLKQDFLCTLT